MTWRQLEDAYQTIVVGHRDRNVSTMLKGVVTNMHALCKFSREAGFLTIHRSCTLHLCMLLKESSQFEQSSFGVRSQHGLVSSGRFGQGLA